MLKNTYKYVFENHQVTQFEQYLEVQKYSEVHRIQKNAMLNKNTYTYVLENRQVPQN